MHSCSHGMSSTATGHSLMSLLLDGGFCTLVLGAGHWYWELDIGAEQWHWVLDAGCSALVLGTGHWVLGTGHYYWVLHGGAVH